MLQPRPVPLLDTEDEEQYNEDVQELYEMYQASSPDFFLIEQEI